MTQQAQGVVVPCASCGAGCPIKCQPGGGGWALGVAVPEGFGLAVGSNAKAITLQPVCPTCRAVRQVQAQGGLPRG